MMGLNNEIQKRHGHLKYALSKNECLFYSRQELFKKPEATKRIVKVH